jgi:hypothetical protein
MRGSDTVRALDQLRVQSFINIRTSYCRPWRATRDSALTSASLSNNSEIKIVAEYAYDAFRWNACVKSMLSTCV